MMVKKRAEQRKNSWLEFCQRHVGLLSISLLTALTLILYWTTLHYGFIFDDLPTIIEYVHIRSSNFWGHVFAHSRWIPRIFQQALYAWTGADPVGYRIAYLLLHLANGLMLYVFFERSLRCFKPDHFASTKSKLIAFLGAALFLLHPVQTQTAAYITQIGMEGVASFFVILGALLFQSYVLAKPGVSKWLWLGAFLVSIVLAAGTKEIIMVMPVLIFVADLLLFRQHDAKAFIKRLPLHGITVVLMFSCLGKLGVNVVRTAKEMPSMQVDSNRGNRLTQAAGEKITTFGYMISQPKVILHYLKIFFMPTGLSFDYDTKLSKNWRDADVLVPFFLLLALLGAMIYMFLRQQFLLGLFSLSWFFIAILPRASVIPTQELVCDYKTYTSSVGMMLLLAWALVHLAYWLSGFIATTSKPVVRHGFYCLMIAITMLAASKRLQVWSSEERLWGDVIAKAPGKSRAYNNYAVCLYERGDIDGAKKMFTKATELDPHYGEPFANLAFCYQAAGDYNRALDHYDGFIRSGEIHPSAYTNLGNLYLAIGDLDKAESSYAMALMGQASYGRAAIGMARTMCARGQYDKAIGALEGRLFINDQEENDARFWMGQAYFNKADFKKALVYLESIKGLGNPYIEYMLAGCYFEGGDYDKATQCYATAYERLPKDYLLLYNYGLALRSAGKAEKALEFFAQCCPFEKELPFVRFQQARCLVDLGRKDEAKKTCEALLRSSKDNDVLRDVAELIKTL